MQTNKWNPCIFYRNFMTISNMWLQMEQQRCSEGDWKQTIDIRACVLTWASALLTECWSRATSPSVLSSGSGSAMGALASSSSFSSFSPASLSHCERLFRKEEKRRERPRPAELRLRGRSCSSSGEGGRASWLASSCCLGFFWWLSASSVVMATTLEIKDKIVLKEKERPCIYPDIDAW